MVESRAPTVSKWGREWRIGIDADVKWITESTPGGLEITSAIPPVFDAYATIVVPRWERDVIARHLREHTRKQKWWLGYLETGASDVVFPDAPRVELYSHWRYVLVLAGPDEALSWRSERRGRRWAHNPGPDLMFPTDRSWLMSWLWDDDWGCVGGSQGLIDSFLAHPDMEVRQVTTTEDATPPGHVAR